MTSTAGAGRVGPGPGDAESATAPAMHDLTSFHRDLLFVIAGLDDPSGQDIKTELDEYYDDEVNHGHLYSNLDRLVRKGLVKKGKADGRTNYYRLTRRGRGVLRDRRQWENEHVPDRIPAGTATSGDG